MRRANGTGSIVDLGQNRRRRYAVRVSYLDRPGLWKQKYVSYHRTAKEAQEALDEYLRSGQKAQTIGITFGEVYEGWSARKYERAGKASVSSYKASWNRLSVLEGKEMKKVTLDDLQGIIDQDEADGLSQSSINNDHILAKALFKYARERNIVEKDPTEFVELPKVGAKIEKGAFSEAQIGELWKMEEAGEPWVDTVLILCYTGFRITELLSLTKESYHAKEGYLQGGIKTAAGKDRIVPVHSRIKPLVERRAEKNGDRLICQENGRPFQARGYRQSVFHEIAEKIGAPTATPHWCRHTAASRMKMAGMDELAVKRILGHSDKDITEHYTHVDITFLRGEMEKVR